MRNSKSSQITQPFHSRHSKVKDYDLLRQLALNLRWAWDRGGDTLWQQLEPELWERTNNPWVVLETASTEKIDALLRDPHFRKELDNLLKLLHEEKDRHPWFQQIHAASPLTCVAYFSMEFMLSEALPIYSGGLGNVAGDQLKAASDLGVPVVGIGLLYQQGYFRQMIDKDGHQLALYPYNDPQQLPISPLCTPDGEWLRIKISLPGYPLWLRAWEVNVGRGKLYLLDSNDAANMPAHRGITSELYGGGSELRLKQELLLGIGGYRLLKALRIKPEVCHLNEGHAAFAVLERASQFMKENHTSFEVALTATRPGNLFTTHTAIHAAFDVFSPFLIEQYLGKYAEEFLDISVEKLLALGCIHPNEPFNMAYLAIRGSGAINGVSRLHGKISRQLFSPLFPKWPIPEVPIGSVTNGVHMPSWESSQADFLWTKACGKMRWLGDTASLEKDILKIPDADIWQMRCSARAELVKYVRLKNTQELEARGALLQEKLFDPNTLTLGFARRFAEYKRPNMLLHDSNRLLRILTNRDRPVQLIIAGKAHPEDEQGLALIKEWFLFMQQAAAQPHVIFLSDYDMLLTERLVHGVDLWINTPRRPWEACGTSGMKVLVNGGLNLSELDGWWAESYTPQVGWAIGEEGITSDTRDANMLYDILENKVIPEFYAHDENGLPTRWVKRIKESMARLTPRFSSNRAVREYTETYYLQAADRYLKRAKDSAHVSKKLVEWLKLLEQHWDAIHFGELKTVASGQTLSWTLQVYLGKQDPESVKVELYADGVNGGKPEQIEMVRKSEHIYECSVTTTRPAAHYTPRILPKHHDILFPLEASYIKWQR